MAAVRGAFSRVGVNTAHYAGHSFRVGAATTAARAGLREEIIKMLGRWESAAYELCPHTKREPCLHFQTVIRDPASYLETISLVVVVCYLYGACWEIHMCALGWMFDDVVHEQCQCAYVMLDLIPD